MTPRRSTRHHAALAALCVLSLSAVARAAPGEGRVRFVSSKRAYLGAGRREGLTIGAVVALHRGPRAIASCSIDQLGDRQSACLTSNARVGDAFALPAKPSAAASTAPPRLAPLPTQAELRSATAALAETPIDKVDFKSSTHAVGNNGATLFSASYAHNAFFTSHGGDYQQERIELQLNGLDVHFAGFRLFAHATAILSTVRPETQRFRPGDLAQLYVWEVALSSRDPQRAYAVSAGRIWPHHTPGLALLDGAQVGWRGHEGTTEVGVYGGTIPDLTTLYPLGDRWTTGVYYAHTLAGKKGRSALRVLQTEGRLGMRGLSGGPGPQLELEWALMATLARWIDLGVQARATIGAGNWSRPALDAARAHLSVRPLDHLRVSAAFRYLDQKTVDYDSLPSGFLSQGRMYHATFDLGWEPRPWVAVQVMAGLDHDSESGNQRTYAGPELSFPRLFHGRGGVAVGYREEVGWYGGRQVYVQLTGGGERFRVVGRLSYLEDRPLGGINDVAYRELGAYVFGEVHIVRWLSARGSAMTHVGFDGFGGSNASVPAGVVARAELIGSL